MPRIKVAHIVTKLEWGGAQQNTLHTVRTLNRDFFDAHLICGPGGILDGEAGRDDVPVEFVSALQRAVHPVKDAAAFFQLRRLLRRLRPDIVHTHSSKAGILGRWAASAAGVPVVVHTFHGFGFHPAQPAPVRAAYVAVERWTARLSTALIAVSRANRDEALARGIGRPDQYHLIRSGVPLAPYRSLASRRDAPPGIVLGAEEKLVTTIGPFKPQKNLKDFLRAAAAVLQRRRDVKFLVIGDGDGRVRLEEEIRRRGLADHVVLAGWRRDVPALLARTDAFCMTSLWEGLPRSLVEAMAAGRPCVVNAVDGCRDLIDDGVNGFLVPPRHPLTTAERLLQILADDDLAFLLGRRARETIGDEFDIDGMVRAQERLYSALWSALTPKTSPA